MFDVEFSSKISVSKIQRERISFIPSSKSGNLFLKFALNLNYLPKKMHITWKSGWNSTQGSI